MKPRRSKQTNQALTLLEVLLVILVLVALAALFLPRETTGRTKAQRIICMNNLKQIGLATRIWKGDHNDQLPMQTSITNGGMMELLNGGISASQLAQLNFLILSNQLATPKILYCPADIHASAAIRFDSGFGNTNISYFVSPDATEQDPQMLLSGDDNFAINGTPVSPGLLQIPTNTLITWTTERHINAGNIGLADGSVQQVNTNNLQQFFRQTGVSTNRLAIP